MRKAILFSLFLLVSQRGFAQTTVTLNGTLKDDKDSPVINTEIAVRGDAFSATKGDGRFAIAVSNQYKPGQTLTLLVKKDGWLINDPVDGHWNLPSAEYFAHQSLTVVIVPKGSLALLTPARLNEQLSRIKDELTRKLSEARQQNRSLATRDAENKAEIAALKQQVMTDLLRQWEKDYGLTVAKMEEVISQYARSVNPADDNRTKGLKAFQNGDYDRAADYFEKAALQDEDDIARKEADLELERLSAFNNWKDKGDAHSNQQKYELAIASYDRAARHVTVERRPQEWAEIKSLIGYSKRVWAEMNEGQGSQLLLAEAVSALREALTVYTREQFPQEWARTQQHLSFALSAQGGRTNGAESTRLLAEAVSAQRELLKIYTREQFPRDWAMTQNNLGFALRAQGARSSGEERMRLWAEAVSAHRETLKVYTREQSPQDWARTQNNLAGILSDQGEWVTSNESIRFLAEAVSVYREALTVYTREQLPQDWAMTQSNLGLTLRSLGMKSSGEESERLLAEAVSVLRESLKIYTHDQSPQEWATIQNNLGFTLRSKGERASGAKRLRLLNEAVIACREALKVRTREHFPQSWMRTQSSLAEAYSLLEDWSNAELAYANVLSVLPEYEWGLEQLSGIYHEQLSRLAEAFALNERRVRLNPDNLFAQCDWAETHFTTARFAEAETRLAALLANPKLDANTKTALRVLEIANALALGKVATVKPKLEALLAAVAQQPADFHVGWSFNGTLHFIGTHEPLAARRDWLRQLITALQAENRDAILTGLRAAQKKFVP